MADIEKTALLDLQFANKDLIADATALRAEITKIREQISQTNQDSNQYTELSNQLKILQQDYRDTNGQIIASSVVNREAEGSVNQLAAQLKVLTNQYNSLSKEEREASKGEFTKQVKKTKDALNEAREAIGNYTGSVGNYAIAGNQFNRLLSLTGESGTKVIETLRGGGEAVISFGQNVKSVDAAFSLTGIGLLVAAVSLLITYFTQSNEGSKTLKAGLSALQAGVQNIIKVVVAFGKVLIDIFSGNLKEAAHDAKIAAESLLNLGKATYQAAKNGYELERARQAQAKSERELTQTITEKEGQLQVAEINARRRDLSAQIREENLNKVRKLRNEIDEDQITIKQQQLDLLNRQATLESKVDYAELARAKRELTEAQNRKIVGQAEDEAIQGKIDLRANKEEKAASSKAARLAKIAKKANEQEVKDAAEAARNKLEATLSESEKEVLSVSEEYEKKLKLARKYNLGVAELEKELAEKVSKIREKEYQDKVKEVDKEAKVEEKKFKLEVKNLEKVTQAALDANAKKIKDDAEAKKVSEDAAAAERDFKIQAIMATLGAITSVTKQSSAINKIAAITGIGISLEQEISGYWKSAAGSGPFGIALAVAETAIGVARAAASIGKIKSAKGFAYGGVYDSGGGGGYVSGPGSGTSDSINARLSNSEVVINARSSQMFGKLLSDINVMGGGRPFDVATKRNFSTGGVFFDGGNSNRYYNEPVVTEKSLANSVAYSLTNNFPPIYTTVTDIQTKVGQVNQIEDRVTL